MKPIVTVVMIQQQNIICASPNDVNDTLQNTTVTSGWVREFGDFDWDDDEE